MPFRSYGVEEVGKVAHFKRRLNIRIPKQK